MSSYYCYGCGVYIHIPLNCDEDEYYDCYYNEECCENAYWVDYTVKKRAQKNWNTFKNKTWAYAFLLKEYKHAKERVKYAPGGIGFYEAFDEFESLKASKKRKGCDINDLQCFKKIK